MIERGWSLYVAGSATNGTVDRTFEYGFDMDVLNRRCVAGDGTDGVVIPNGALVDAQITLHLDHLFFDNLRLDLAEMRFDAMAAAADADGHVTLESLEGQRLADLQGIDGGPLVDEDGAPVTYDPGSAALDTPTLASLVREAATTIGHWNGEGHCEYVVR